MRRKSKLIAALGLAFLCTSANAITVSLLADPAEVASGGIVSVDIVATGFGEDEFASAYDFSISFDPLEFAFVADSWVVGSALGAIFDVDFFDDSDFSGADLGSLSPFVTSTLDDATLADLQSGASEVLGSFDLLARRTSIPLVAAIGLGCNSVSGPLDENGLATLLDITACSGASVSVAPGVVPEPGTLALFALGLLGIAVVIRRSNGGR